ncbi:MAG: histidine phosphatase family protein [Methylotetracoccus sp.]
MKQLFVIRHAKSSWSDPSLSDRDRPLNKRGKHDAPLMGRVLRERGAGPDLMVASPARRARKTALLIAEEIGYPREAISIDERIYEAGTTGIMELIEALPESAERVYLIGHNPVLTDLVNELTGDVVGHLPTCAIAAIEFAGEAWSETMRGAGRLMFFDYPKRHRPADASTDE